MKTVSYNVETIKTDDSIAQQDLSHLQGNLSYNIFVNKDKVARVLIDTQNESAVVEVLNINNWCIVSRQIESLLSKHVPSKEHSELNEHQDSVIYNVHHFDK